MSNPGPSGCRALPENLTRRPSVDSRHTLFREASPHLQAPLPPGSPAVARQTPVAFLASLFSPGIPRFGQRPLGRLALGNLWHLAPAGDAGGRGSRIPVFPCLLIPFLDQQPILPLFSLPGTHTDESKAALQALALDRKSTRLNSSHVKISYAV